jgi:vacuolar-type H+-ATPase subunit I/STV1
MLVGALAGPIGLLLGGTYGALVGMNAATCDAAFAASMLEQITDKLDDGMVAIVALAGEETEAALDEKLSAYDTVIARFDAEVVAAEVDEAYKMQDEMARQAREQLRKEKKEKAREELEKNADILSANFTK